MQQPDFLTYYQDGSKLEVEKWCRETPKNTLFCQDRELRYRLLSEYYAHWERDAAFTEFLSLLQIEDLKSLERLTVLLTLYPEFTQRHIMRKGEEAIAPLLTAKSSLVAYTLLSFGAHPSMKEVSNVDAEVEYVPDIEQTLNSDASNSNEGFTQLQVKDSHNFRRWWCRFRGQAQPWIQAAIDEGQLDDIVSLSPFISSETKLKAPSHGGENFYALQVNLLEQARRAVSTRFMMDSLSAVPPNVMLFRLFICYGLSLERDMYAPGVSLLQAIDHWIVGNGDNIETQRIRRLVDNLQLVMQAGREQLLRRADYLTMDYSALAYLNTRRLMPFWSHEDFWVEKYQRDYPQGTSTSPALSYRLRCLYHETRVRAYHNDEVFCFSYHEGRGFITALLLCGYSGEFHEEHPVFPNLVLSIPVERSAFLTWCSSYGLHFASSRVDLPSIIAALDDDILELHNEGESYYGCPLPSKQYTLTFHAVIGRTLLKARVQFDNIDFLRGALTLCRYFGVDGTEAISELRRIV